VAPPTFTQPTQDNEAAVLSRELRYHEQLYSGFAQAHFARPAVRALRRHLAGRILQAASLGPGSRVLSLGCGIGDTELLLAPHVREIVGLDLSPAAIRQARQDAERLGLSNARFLLGTLPLSDEPPFDAVIAVFFLHHLPQSALAALPSQVALILKPGGRFYSLDPNCRRLSGAVGRLLFPKLMKKYQTEDERELDPAETAECFRRAGFESCWEIYDFASTPLAGLLPGWRWGYQLARRADDWLLKIPPLRLVGSNFEVRARKRP
jgi:cyclopropane fatty-acyl-phospholipid synthase-like methyltransferase